MIAHTETESVNKCQIPSQTELDSHVNMVVVGKHYMIFDDTGKTCTVNSFSKSAGKIDNVSIVDAVIAYDCPYQSKTYLLLLRNALHIPEMSANLIPPFVLREAGIVLNKCPKLQLPEPTVNTHSMYCPKADLRIHFSLHNTFSYFETRTLIEDELLKCDKIFITPDTTE